jgi:hypothetical protein
MPLHLDEAEMKAEVLRQVRPGMPIEEAKREMERHCFACKYEADESTFSQEQAVQGRQLVCSRFKPQSVWWHNFFVSDEVRVVISIEAEAVKEVTVRCINVAV